VVITVAHGERAQGDSIRTTTWRNGERERGRGEPRERRTEREEDREREKGSI
jgi:hypothetical protein